MALRLRMAAVIGCLLLFLPNLAGGDIIYFKDGMRTVCRHRAWEDANEVKCEYDGVILTYRKEDVEHIQKIMPTAPAEEPTRDTGGQVESTMPTGALQTGTAAESASTPFYDPRRPFKYWSKRTSKHRTYREAIDALAAEFNQSAEFIETQIGSSNDLDEIRARLSGAQPSAPRAAVQTEPTKSTSGIEFYNPRREFKYWISGTEKYRSYEEAIQALGREFGRPPEWVETHMGSDNDLTAVRENLRKRNTEAGGP